MDESIRDALVSYTLPKEIVNSIFEEIYEDELKILGIDVVYAPKVFFDDDNEFMNSGCRHVRKKSLRKVRLGRKRAKLKTRLASPLCPIKRTHLNDGKRTRGMKPKKI